MLLALEERDETSPNRDNAHNHHYIEITNAGHCPNHEAPSLVGHIASRWTGTNERQKDKLNLLERLDNYSVLEEPWGRFVAREVSDDETNLNLVEKIITSMV